MKRIITSAAMACLLFLNASYATAQENTAPVYTPEAGDFSVGVDLIPLFRTIGGAFNDSETPVGGHPFLEENMLCKPNVSIIGKYMFSDKWGIKVDLGLMVKSNNYRSYVQDDKMVVLDPLSEAKVVDRERITKTGGSLMVGAEYRLGKRRVQGVFGMGALFGFSSLKTSYSYGNAITELNQQPTSSMMENGYRITEQQTSGANIMAGIYGSIGAEWFVAPKIAIGADVKLSLFGIFGTQAWQKSEGWNEALGRVEKRTDLLTPGNDGINFSTDNIGGALYMNFYF